MSLKKYYVIASDANEAILKAIEQTRYTVISIKKIKKVNRIEKKADGKYMYRVIALVGSRRRMRR